MDEEDLGEHMAGSTIQAQQGFSMDPSASKERNHLQSTLGAAPDELLIATHSNAKGYQLLKAMGFKDRGHSRYCFKHYDSPGSSDDDYDDLDAETLLARQESTTRKSKGNKYYTGPLTFKADYQGIGYRAGPNELKRLRDGTIDDGTAK
jgi:hypothetical protein